MHIPEITDERLKELAIKIRPVYIYENELTWIEPVKNLRRTAFSWDPSPGAPAENLEKLTTIQTLHTFGYHGFFKPSVAEVLAQMPEWVEEQGAVAFSTVGPKNAQDLNDQRDAVKAGYHQAQTTFYKQAVVDRQDKIQEIKE